MVALLRSNAMIIGPLAAARLAMHGSEPNGVRPVARRAAGTGLPGRLLPPAGAGSGHQHRGREVEPTCRPVDRRRALADRGAGLAASSDLSARRARAAQGLRDL